MLGGLFGKKDLLSGVEEKSLEQQLNEYAEGLKTYHREDLESILRKSIKDRLGIREKVSDEKLSIMLVDILLRALLLVLVRTILRSKQVHQQWLRRLWMLQKKSFESILLPKSLLKWVTISDLAL